MTQDLHIAEPPICAASEQRVVTAQLGTPAGKYKDNFGWKVFISVLSMLGGSAFLTMSMMSFLHSGVDLTGVAALFIAFPLVSYGFVQLRMAMIGHAEPVRV